MNRPLRSLAVAIVATTALTVGACSDAPGADGASGSAPSGSPQSGGEEGVEDVAGEDGPDAPTVEGAPDAEESEAAEGTARQVPALHPEIDDLDETLVTISTSAGGEAVVAAKVATTTSERRRGLMRVADLPAGTGMLFVFEEDRTGGFWMYETLVSLDVAFADESGVVRSILAMDPCDEQRSSDCPVFTPDTAYRTALEVPQGWFESQDVRVGDTLTWTEPTAPD